MCLITILVTPPTTETFKFTFYAPCVAIPPCSIIHMMFAKSMHHIHSIVYDDEVHGHLGLVPPYTRWSKAVYSSWRTWQPSTSAIPPLGQQYRSQVVCLYRISQWYCLLAGWRLSWTKLLMENGNEKGKNEVSYFQDKDGNEHYHQENIYCDNYLLILGQLFCAFFLW